MALWWRWGKVRTSLPQHNIFNSRLQAKSLIFLVHPPLDTSLRDGLLVFFLLVLPVIILGVIAVVKKDAIKRRLCRECRRRQRYEMKVYSKQDGYICNKMKVNSLKIVKLQNMFSKVERSIQKPLTLVFNLWWEERCFG